MLETLGQGVRDFGEDPAAAHVVKLAGNFLIAAASEAMAEAYTLGEKCGLDRVQLAEFFGATLFPSRIYQNYGKAIAEHRYEPAGFKLRLGLKDLRLVLGAADACEMPMPLASILHDRFLALAAQGHGEIDWTGIGLAVAKEAGAARPPDECRLKVIVLGHCERLQIESGPAWQRQPRRTGGVTGVCGLAAWRLVHGRL